MGQSLGRSRLFGRARTSTMSTAKEGGTLGGVYSRRSALAEFLKQVRGDKSSGAGHWIVGFIPQSAVIVQNMKKIALIEREVLGSGGFVGTESPDNLLGGLDSSRGFGEGGEGRRCRNVVMLVVFVAIQ